jgi:hypothetical protein
LRSCLFLFRESTTTKQKSPWIRAVAVRNSHSIPRCWKVRNQFRPGISFIQFSEFLPIPDSGILGIRSHWNRTEFRALDGTDSGPELIPECSTSRNKMYSHRSNVFGLARFKTFLDREKTGRCKPTCLSDQFEPFEESSFKNLEGEGVGVIHITLTPHLRPHPHPHPYLYFYAVSWVPSQLVMI